MPRGRKPIDGVDAAMRDYVGACLRSLRERAGLSQQQAGEVSRINRVTIARLELGLHIPTLPTLYKLAHAYGSDTVEIAKLVELRFGRVAEVAA